MRRGGLALLALLLVGVAAFLLRPTPVSVSGAQMAFDPRPSVRASRTTLDVSFHGELGPPWSALTRLFGTSTDSGFFVVTKVVFTQPLEARHYRLHGHVRRTGAGGTPVFDPEPDHDPRVASVLVDLEAMLGQAAKIDQLIDGDLEFDLVPIGKGRLTGWVTLTSVGSMPAAKEPATVTVNSTFERQLD